LLLEPSAWLPVTDQPDRVVSMMSALHLLELMKNAVLTVEAMTINAVTAN